MKKQLLRALPIALLFCFSCQITFSQCGALNPAPVGTFCEGQRAEFTINDPDPNNVYGWYRDGDMALLGYGVSGDGRYFVSPNDIPAGTTSVSFWYARERPEIIGPSSTIAMAGGQDAGFASSDYEMKFDAQSDFVLNSVTIDAKVYYADPSKTWGFMVRIADPTQLGNNAQGQFSPWYSYRFTSTNFEKIVIPVNLTVKAGTGYTIQIKSGDAAQNLSAADLAHWYSTGSYAQTTYLTAPSQITVIPQTKSVNGSSVLPLIQDWDIKLKCPPVKVTAVKSTNCCSPMGTNFQVNTPKEVVRDNDLPLVLSVTGTDAVSTYYYEWYDSQKNLIAGSAGMGKTTVQIDKPGVFYVRIVKDQAYKNSFSCYKENSVLVQKRVLFAEADKRNLCTGESATLIASGATANILWSPATGLSSTTSKSVTASPGTAGKITYTVSATVPVGNLVVDGDFDESTNAVPKFETTYNLGATIPNGNPNPNGHGVIGTRAAADWNLSGKFCDDTVGFYTGDRGKFLFADAQSSPSNPVPASWGINNYIWQQSNLPVEIGKQYEFRFLVTDWGVESLTDATKTADVQMYINGVPQMATPLEINKRCRWTEVKVNWTATTSKATLSIADVNAQNVGGEFAIDDISFGAPGTQTDTVSLIVGDCGYVIARSDANVCMGEGVKLSAVTNGIVTGWTPKADLNDPSSATPTAYPIQTTEYTVEARFPATKFFSNTNFDQGYVDFTNGLTSNQYYLNQGNYYISPRPVSPARTTRKGLGGTGNLLTVNTSVGTSVVLFSKDITVVKDSTYGLAFYLTDLSPDFTNVNQWANAEIEITVNGNVVQIYKAPQDTLWHIVSHIWKAPSNGSVKVEIKSTITAGANASISRLMGIDELTLAMLTNPKTDKMTVTTRNCFSIDATTDNICHGDSIQIKVETNGLFTGWTVLGGGTAGIKDPKAMETWVKPSIPTKYVASAQIQLGNMIDNGDFELGDKVGFDSDYQNGTNSGQYVVGSYTMTSYNNQSWVAPKRDHTTGSGLMYMSDGGFDPTKNVYKTTVNVVSGRQYAFSAWLANIHADFMKPNPDTTSIKTTNLAFIINGQQLGRIKLPLDTTWHQFYSVWTSNFTGPIEIAIQDREIAQGGNDFVMDDLVFAPLLPDIKYDTIDVVSCRVCNKPVVNLNITSSDTSICQGSSLTLGGKFTDSRATSDKLYYLWYKKGVSILPTDYTELAIPISHTVPATTLPIASGTYVLRVQDGNVPSDAGCYGEDTLKVIVDTVPTFTVKDSRICVGSPFLLDSLVTNQLPKKGNLQFFIDTLVSPINSLILKGGTYFARVTSSFAKCVTTKAIRIDSLFKPIIATEPQSDGSCEGSKLTVPVTATGTAPLSYKWYKGATFIKDTVALYFNPLVRTDSGDYHVVISNVCGDATSQKAKVSITLFDDPKVSLTVNKDVVCTDSLVVLTATPSGGGSSLSFTFKDGNTVIGAPPSGQNTWTTTGLQQRGKFTVSMAFTTACPKPTNYQNPVYSDTVYVDVDQYVNAVVGTPNPRSTCTNEVQLPGSISPALPTAKGTWSISPTSPDKASVIVSPNDPTSDLSNIDFGKTVELLWIVENGVCPKDTATYTVIQVGSITKAKISLDGGVYANEDLTNGIADTLCVGTSYTLSGSDPLKPGESSEWKIEQAGNTNISVNASASSQTILASATGATVVSYVIFPSISSCPIDSATITFVVHEGPTITGFTVPSVMPCEDPSKSDSVFVKYTSTLPVTYLWNVISNGTGSATLLNATDTLAILKDYASTATTGAKDSVKVGVKLTNACSSDNDEVDVVFRLKPRDLFPNDAIQGLDKFCESELSQEYHFGQMQPNTDLIQWSWNTKVQDVTANDPNDPITILRDSAWGIINQETNAVVYAQLGNVCGLGVIAQKPVVVTDAVDFTFTVSTDRPQNSFCIPLDQVSIWANQTAPDSAVQPNVAEYVFEDQFANILQGQSPIRVFRSRFTSDTTIFVRARPNPNACLNSYDDTVQAISLTGYNRPLDTLVYSQDTICEKAGAIQVYASPNGRNSGTIKWYNIQGANSPVLVGEGGTISRKGPNESGLLFATVQNKFKQIDPTSQCPDGITDTVAIKIYDNPNPVFATEALLIYYDPNSPGIKMPLVDTSTVDKVFDIHYDPGTWLSTQDSLTPTIKTTRDEIEIVYTIKMKTGDPSKGDIAVCENEASIRVINTLPLRIPNAFSPNGDGKNETWVIEGLGKYPNARVKVFNRWGNAIFTDNYGYSVPWDGTHNGVLLASGTYYYVIDLLGSPDGKEEVRTGSLTIVR